MATDKKRKAAGEDEGGQRLIADGEFPKMLYLLGDPSNQKIVNSLDEEDALGADWYDAPVDPLAA